MLVLKCSCYLPLIFLLNLDTIFLCFASWFLLHVFFIIVFSCEITSDDTFWIEMLLLSNASIGVTFLIFNLLTQLRYNFFNVLHRGF